MTFNSLEYCLFLPVVYLVFLVVGDRARWMVLLAASLLFYAALQLPYLPAVLALVTTASYLFGLLLDRAESIGAKRAWLWTGIAVNVAVLVAMKYLPFLALNLKALAAMCSLDDQLQPVRALVAIGVSYYVFQATSYLVDVYLETEKPERHFGYFALYMAFFPKLLQGPIERAGYLLPQLKRRYRFDYLAARSGLLLFIWGMFKKVVVADRLAVYADRIFNDVHAYSGLSLMVGVYAYALQIYFDFAGYTDMAIGTARLFGIDLTANFDSPYLATSIADFWRRWHISFSRWILDYLFKPLQLQWRDWGQAGGVLALIVTFAVSGLWHGASWGFIVWGLLQGVYLAASRYYLPYQKRLYRLLGVTRSGWLKSWQTLVTFNLTCFAWIFFRANNLSDAFYVIANLCNWRSNYSQALKMGGGNFIRADLLAGQGLPGVLLLSAAMVAMVAVYKNRRDSLFEKPALFRWPVYHLLLVSILFSSQHESNFLYFRF